MRVWRTPAGRRAVEGVAAELVAVVGEHALEPPAGGLELGGDAAREAEVCSTLGPPVGQTTSRPRQSLS